MWILRRVGRFLRIRAMEGRMAEHPIMFDEDDPALARLRGLALALPGAEERIAHGRPWFFAGQAFAIYGGGTKGPDRVQHDHALLVHIDDDEHPARLQDPRFFVPGYVGPKGWLGIDLDAPDTDWTEIGELLDASFRRFAPARLLRELDARA
jgi:hypothetical protein